MSKQKLVKVTPTGVRVPLPGTPGIPLRYLEPGQTKVVDLKEGYWTRQIYKDKSLAIVE